MTQYSPARVVGVTVGLSAAGAAFGGLAGAGALAVVIILSGEWSILVSPSLLLFAGGIGAVLGAVCAPLAGWLLLRRVPLGRVFGGLTLGTIIGGVVGWFAPVTEDPIVRPIAAGAVGFLITAILLRFRHGRSAPRRESQVAPPS